jgi:hypothetical protein
MGEFEFALLGASFAVTSEVPICFDLMLPGLGIREFHQIQIGYAAFIAGFHVSSLWMTYETGLNQ